MVSFVDFSEVSREFREDVDHNLRRFARNFLYIFTAVLFNQRENIIPSKHTVVSEQRVQHQQSILGCWSVVTTVVSLNVVSRNSCVVQFEIFNMRLEHLSREIPLIGVLLENILHS